MVTPNRIFFVAPPVQPDPNADLRYVGRDAQLFRVARRLAASYLKKAA